MRRELPNYKLRTSCSSLSENRIDLCFSVLRFSFSRTFLIINRKLFVRPLKIVSNRSAINEEFPRSLTSRVAHYSSARHKKNKAHVYPQPPQLLLNDSSTYNRDQNMAIGGAFSRLSSGTAFLHLQFANLPMKILTLMTLNEK